jgi:hypothetical protein
MKYLKRIYRWNLRILVYKGEIIVPDKHGIKDMYWIPEGMYYDNQRVIMNKLNGYSSDDRHSISDETMGMYRENEKVFGDEV